MTACGQMVHRWAEWQLMRKIIIIGAGAAGLMAAYAASAENNKVILLERNEKPGKKLFITGKGRCNLTNACDMKELQSHVVTNPKFLYSAFHRFTNQDMIAFLHDQGVETKVERGQRVFPLSDHSSDVIRALKSACLKKKVDIRYYSRVSRILTQEADLLHKGDVTQKEKLIQKSDLTQKDEDKKPVFAGVVLEDGSRIKGDALIIATGGYSYQTTGSDGDGYRFARELSHTVKEPAPSLVPFETRETWCRDLMGLSLKNVAVLIRLAKKTIYQGFGEFLFTHYGVSGPLVLTASTRFGKKGLMEAMKEGRLLLYLDLKPALDEEQLKKRFLREFDIWKNKNISNVIEQMLPKKMVPVFLNIADVAPDKKVHDISRQERSRMIQTMKALPLHISGLRGFDEAIITRGGVHVREIDPMTMESKKVKNVYFAGEVMDVDAETGGYNLQIAWSTGYVAGISAGTCPL